VNDAQRTALALKRLMARLDAQVGDVAEPRDWRAFKERLETHFPDLFKRLLRLYGQEHDFFYHLEDLIATLATSWLERPTTLKSVDAGAAGALRNLSSAESMGAVCYVDRFAGTLRGMSDHIPYLKRLGVTYLHLMPLFRSPPGNDDGGYAISSYRAVDPALGTIEDLSDLATDLRAAGITLVLDFVFNHTADDHDWALKARAGDPEYQDYYFMFPDRVLPDAYETMLRPIFPDQRPGSFTYFPDVDRWVWTTFNSFQWDLNYRNPAVFTRMAAEMLFLANLGVGVLRFDALAFIWKQLGTTCESLPEAHLLLKAFNLVARIAAPSLLFKSEAILPPAEVVQYIDLDECQLSYNPLVMALMWEALATRQVRLLQASLARHFTIDPRCVWVEYVRSHDDIGWTFDDDDARRVGIDPQGHRRFLNDFYTGRFPGSFARGLPFGENHVTGDARIAGTCASLAGLEKALLDGSAAEIELSVRRILLLYSVALSIGGVPLLYLGDEVGTLNDYSYQDDPVTVVDNRWVHRPIVDWTAAAYIQAPRETEGQVDAPPTTVQGRIFAELTSMIEARKGCLALAGTAMTVLDLDDEHVFGYRRGHNGEYVLVLVNVSEHDVWIKGGAVVRAGLGAHFHDILTNAAVDAARGLALTPYRVLWLLPAY